MVKESLAKKTKEFWDIGTPPKHAYGEANLKNLAVFSGDNVLISEEKEPFCSFKKAFTSSLIICFNLVFVINIS